MNADNRCLIWGTACEEVREDNAKRLISVKSSPRAGGDYEIEMAAAHAVKTLDGSQKARLTSLVTERRIEGDALPRIDEADVVSCESRRPLPVYERAKRLLRCLAAHSLEIGQILAIRASSSAAAYSDDLEFDNHSYDLFRIGLAWADCRTLNEFNFLADYLSIRGLISKDIKMELNGGVAYGDWSSGEYLYRVEIPGYSLIEEMETNPESTQCFVAMWFDPSMSDVYKRGIRPAILNAGYKPLRIDQKHDLIDKIDDAIIAEIRRSRFLVADFTHGDEGVRGGVYYEAGFARGLSIPVIFMCRDDKISEVHFDTRQFNHILWNPANLDGLASGLTSRIIASIGEGSYQGG